MNLTQAVKSKFHPSRRQLLSSTVGAASMFLTTGRGRQAYAQATGVAPKPIPGGVTNSGVFIHHFPPVLGNEPSQITDFDGLVALARITGSGTGTDSSGAISRLTFQADMGIMSGIYIGIDEQPYLGSFGFV